MLEIFEMIGARISTNLSSSTTKSGKRRSYRPPLLITFLQESFMRLSNSATAPSHCSAIRPLKVFR